MDNNKQPGIKFDSIMLVKEEFNRIPDLPETVKLKLDMYSEIKGDQNKASNELTSVLTGMSEEGKEVFKLNTIFVGIFSTIKEMENMDLEEFMNKNSAALMFPYVREHITLVTQKSGMSPVMLAPINVMAILEQSKQSKSS